MVVTPSKHTRGGVSVLDRMKAGITSGGKGKRGLFFLNPDTSAKVHFLWDDLNQAVFLECHDAFDSGVINVPCGKYYDKPCKYCKGGKDIPETKLKEFFALPIFVYTDNPKKGDPIGEQKVFMYKSGKASPLPLLMKWFQRKGHIGGNAFVIDRIGKGTDTTYSLSPEEPYEEFDMPGVKPLKEREIMKVIAEAQCPELLYDDEDEEAYDEEEDEIVEEVAPKRSKQPAGKLTPPAPKKTSRLVEEDDEDEDEVAPPPPRRKARPVVEEEVAEELEEEEEEEVAAPVVVRKAKKKVAAVVDEDGDEGIEDAKVSALFVGTKKRA